MNKIVYLMGKSASGKDTLYRRLCEQYPEFSRPVPYTTRPMRHGEAEGKEYHFISEEDVRRFSDEGRIIELRAYDTARGLWKYLTVDDGQIDLKARGCLMIGTLFSYREIKEYYGAQAVLPVYIEVEDGLRLSRALARERQQEEPHYEEMCRRFLADCSDFSEENLKKSGIKRRFSNVDMETCLREIKLYLDENL